MESGDDLSTLVSAWCRWYDIGASEDRWAEQDVIATISNRSGSVEETWQFVLALLEEAPNNKVLGIIGASPIEDLLAWAPDRVAALIAAEAPGNQRLRLALSHMWQGPGVTDEVFAAMKALSEPLP